MATLAKISRPQKLKIARDVRAALAERLLKEGTEPSLDAYIGELDAIIGHLQTHVDGKSSANAARLAAITLADETDDLVDTWLRRIFYYLDIDARRRTGPNIEAATAVRDAAFPDGLAHVDERVVDENAHCRSAVTALSTPSSVATLTSIEMPATWVPSFAASIDASDQADAALLRTRGDKSGHIDLGEEAELDWNDIMSRLRHYISTRAKRSERAKKLQGTRFLESLTTELLRMKADASARATRRAKVGPPAPAATTPAATTPTASTTPAVITPELIKPNLS